MSSIKGTSVAEGLSFNIFLFVTVHRIAAAGVRIDNRLSFIGKYQPIFLFVCCVRGDLAVCGL
jgi:hypothetical protein